MLKISEAPRASRKRRTAKAAPGFGATRPVVEGGMPLSFWTIVAATLVVPLFVGGRHPWGQVVLLGLSTLGLLMAGLSQLRKNKPAFPLSGAEWLVAAGVTLLALQLVPLPEEVLRILSPAVVRILPLWTKDGAPAQLGRWQQISLAPAETWHCLWLFLAYVFLFYVVLSTVKNRRDLVWTLASLGLAGFFAALVAFLQYASGTDRFLGIYEHPFRKASEYLTGSFSTKNHFGHFLGLAVGPLLFFVVGSGKESASSFLPGRTSSKAVGTAVRLFGPVALTVVLGAILFSLSRGAILATAVAVVFFVGVVLWRGLLRWKLALAILLACVAAAAIASLAEGQRLRQRLGSLFTADLEALDHRAARRLIWSTTIKAIPDFAPLGAGAGTFREVYPTYLSRHDFPRYFTHAESGYLQLALEMGFPGLVLGLMGIGLGLAWVGRAVASRADQDLVLAGAAIGTSLLVSIVHSFVDFVWYVPGCMVPTVILFGCVCRLAQFCRQTPQPEAKVPRWVFAGGLGLAGVVGLVGLVHLSGLAQAGTVWDQYLLAVRSGLAEDQAGRPTASETASLFESVDLATDERKLGLCDSIPSSEDSPEFDPRSPDDSDRSDRKPGSLNTLGSGQGEAQKDARAIPAHEEQETSVRLRQRIALLESVLRWFPYHARAHLELARCYLELFEAEQARSDAPLPLVHIRDAAKQCGFENPEARCRWLDAVLEDRREYLAKAKAHAVASLRLCPLLAENYLLLADLVFVDEEDTSLEERLVQQALRARPKDGTILFAVGQREMVAGNLEAGLRLWQEAFRCGTVYQERILRRLVGRVCPGDVATEVEFFVDFFDPPLALLRWLHDYYETQGAEAALTGLRERIAARAVEEAKQSSEQQAVDLWLLAARMFQKLGRQEERLVAAKEAYRLAPANYRVRYFLAEAYLATGDLGEAERHFQWCALRKPGNESLRQKLRQIHTRLVAGEGKATGPQGRSF